MSDSDDDGPRREWRNEGRATAAVLSTRDEPFRPAAVNSSISSSSSSSSRIDVDRNRDRHWERHTRRSDRDRDREDRPRYVAFLRPATQHHAQLAAACASSFYTLSHIPSLSIYLGNYATNQPLLVHKPFLDVQRTSVSDTTRNRQGRPLLFTLVNKKCGTLNYVLTSLILYLSLPFPLHVFLFYRRDGRNPDRDQGRDRRDGGSDRAKDKGADRDRRDGRDRDGNRERDRGGDERDKVRDRRGAGSSSSDR